MESSIPAALTVMLSGLFPKATFRKHNCSGKAPAMALGSGPRATQRFDCIAQTNLMPFAVNTPIACGGVTVMPGDIIIADDDGAVCVPAALAAEMVQNANKQHDWEDFSRMKLMAGEPLQRYYPLHDDARSEHDEWRKLNPIKTLGH